MRATVTRGWVNRASWIRSNRSGWERDWSGNVALLPMTHRVKKGSGEFQAVLRFFALAYVCLRGEKYSKARGGCQ